MSLVSSVYCTSCSRIFDDETRRPCLGLCGHAICWLCRSEKFQSPKEKCPTCDVEGSFANASINFSGEQILKTIRESITAENYGDFEKELNNVDQGKCSKCVTSGKLRICRSCFEADGFLSEHPKGTWTLKSPRHLNLTGERLFLRAKSMGLCADCFIDHRGDNKGHNHIFLANLRSDLCDNLNLKIVMMRSEFALQNIQKTTGNQKLERKIQEFRSIAHTYDTWTKIKGVENLREAIIIKGIVYPNLVDIKEKSFQKAKEVFEFNDKLRAYKLRCDIGNLKKWMSELELPEESTKELEAVEKDLLNLMENPIFEVSKEELKSIYEEVQARMLELELEQKTGSFLTLPSCDRFFKHRAIIQEIKDGKKVRNEIEKRLLEEHYNNGEFQDKILRILTGEDHLSAIPEFQASQNYIRHVEVVDRSLKVDELLMENSKVTRRLLICELMKQMYFSEEPRMSKQLKIYTTFIDAVDNEDSWENIDLFSL